MQQEEEFWALKSRLNWAAHGDRNTSFFHVSTLVRRHRITDETGVKTFILLEYHKLCETRMGFATLLSDIECFACYFPSEEDKNCLSTPIAEEEIRQGLWALRPFKAPSADGLHAGFFQYFWADVKNFVCNEITCMFDKRKVPECMNETLITLIPKCPNPENFNNYRLISLCNNIYKVVTKIIVGRIRPFLDKLISPNKAAFVPRRRGLDNVVIA